MASVIDTHGGFADPSSHAGSGNATRAHHTTPRHAIKQRIFRIVDYIR